MASTSIKYAASASGSYVSRMSALRDGDDIAGLVVHDDADPIGTAALGEDRGFFVPSGLGAVLDNLLDESLTDSTGRGLRNCVTGEVCHDHQGRNPEWVGHDRESS